VRSDDQFHVGIVVDDFEASLADLSALFGTTWCPEIALPTEVTLPTGNVVIDLGFVYSVATPRVEVIRTIPGTLWVPVAGSGIHHLGYWSDDVAADAARLEGRGYAAEAAGNRPDGTPVWAYHRHPSGPRIEIVSRSIQPSFEQYWASGTAA
jgi:Glyoxalase/Bleomycin resistance protein/Dioxygenase superfamily